MAAPRRRRHRRASAGHADVTVNNSHVHAYDTPVLLPVCFLVAQGACGYMRKEAVEFVSQHGDIPCESGSSPEGCALGDAAAGSDGEC